MLIDTHRRIAELVDDNYAYAAVLDYFGIKFYDFDQATLAQACRERGLRVEQVIAGLESVYERSSDLPLATYPIDLVVAYLKHTHFVFIKERLPYLSKLIHNLRAADSTEVVKDLQFIFPLFVEDLIHHIYQEEDELFSYILSLHQAYRAPNPSSQTYYDLERSTIQDFAVHHSADDDDMEGIRNIVHNYDTRRANSLHLRVVYAELQRFERDLKVHASVENEILFPKALALEKQVKKALREKVVLN
jgi:regulator of cell morphogenesis and NO signaling